MMEMSTTAPQREITLMDLWLIVYGRRRLAAIIIGLVAVLGIVLAFALPAQYQYRTAIEIGNQVVNGQIQPIEAPLTVIAKLQNGYIPALTNKFVEENADGPKKYDFDVQGSKDSQIVTIVSQGPKRIADKHISLHRLIADALVQDHNRTVDEIRANDEILLSEAQQNLNGLVADEKSLGNQITTFDGAVTDMQRQSKEIESRVTQLEGQLVTLRNQGGDAAHATQAMLIAQEIGQLKAVQVDLDQKTIEARIPRAKTEAKLENNAAQQDTARNTIKYRETTLKNIQVTRSLGTVTSIQPVAPNKPVVVAVAVVLGVLIAVLAALADDFFARANTLRQAQMPPR